MIRMNIATPARTSEQENARSTTGFKNIREGQTEKAASECASGLAEKAAKEGSMHGLYRPGRNCDADRNGGCRI